MWPRLRYGGRSLASSERTDTKLDALIVENWTTTKREQLQLSQKVFPLANIQGEKIAPQDFISNITGYLSFVVTLMKNLNINSLNMF